MKLRFKSKKKTKDICQCLRLNPSKSLKSTFKNTNLPKSAANQFAQRLGRKKSKWRKAQVSSFWRKYLGANSHQQKRKKAKSWQLCKRQKQGQVFTGLKVSRIFTLERNTNAGTVKDSTARVVNQQFRLNIDQQTYFQKIRKPQNTIEI